LNVNSNPQLLNAFAAIDLPLSSTSKAETSQSPDQDHPAIVALREYRTAKSAYTEKIKSLLDVIRPDGRIHAEYVPLGTDTGRFSCKDPNVQQIPGLRKAPIRKAFRAPEGRKLIKLDYNQMELRACASYTGETTLLKAYRDRADVHRLTASTIFGVPLEEVTSAQRSLGKTINFGFLYGMGAKGFAEGLKAKENIDVLISDAEFYRRKFFENYPGLKQWHSGCWDEVRRVPGPKEVRTPLGRRRWLADDGSNFNNFTSLTNVPIQGGCADATKLAMIVLADRFPQGTGFVAMLHDELVIETDAAIADEMLALAKQVMEESAGRVFDKVPMLVEGKVVDSWG
jgi:DNA polymerase-1